MNGCRAAPELNTPWTGDAQFSWRVGKQQTVALVFAATDAASELVELSQTKCELYYYTVI